MFKRRPQQRLRNCHYFLEKINNFYLKDLVLKIIQNFRLCNVNIKFVYILTNVLGLMTVY